MNQKALVQTISRLTHLPQVAIIDVLRTAADVVATNLGHDLEKSVTLPGFGKFVARRSASRRMKIFGTDEYRIVGGQRRAKFLPSGAFQEAVRGESPS